MDERTGPPAADITSPPAGSVARHVAEFAEDGVRHEAAEGPGASSGVSGVPGVPGVPGVQRPPVHPEPSRTIPSQRYYTLIVERISVLAALGFNAPTIAQALGREGYTMAPGRSDPISLTTVRRLLRENTSASRRRPAAVRGEGLAAHEWWLQDLAAELSMPSITLYGWARRGWVTVVRKESRPPYRLVLRADPADTARLRARRPNADGEGLRPAPPPLPRGRGGAPQCSDPSGPDQRRAPSGARGAARPATTHPQWAYEV
ncbi:hypothetical protein ACFU9Y_21470 [Streptomyces sp. NPDC057621]|uniref:hypothetical protein n=1 Tax=Streptomyces sp. NPDC057621 TaxID=3346186 RepID=UPI00367BE28A